MVDAPQSLPLPHCEGTVCQLQPERSQRAGWIANHFEKFKQLRKIQHEILCFVRQGSAHSVLAPYWGQRLAKTKMLARLVA